MRLIILIASIMRWSLTKQTSEDARISDSENGSVTSSFSNIIIDCFTFLVNCLGLGLGLSLALGFRFF